MDRLQRLYQTQRGRNIMSLVESKRSNKGNQEGAVDTTTHLNGTTQGDTMVTLKETMNNC